MRLLNRCLFVIAIATATIFSATDPAMATRRALLIGISSYQHVPQLDNPSTDVKKIGEKLTTAQYVVTTVKDPDATRDKLLTAIDKFLKTIKQGDEVLVYYSGHGVDINGANMFVPVDSPGSQDVDGAFALGQRLIPMRPLMAQIEDHEPAIQVWIVDACRNNPYAAGGRPFAASGGLQKFDERPNSFIFFAASYSQIARDTLPLEAANSALGSPFSRTFAALFDDWKDKDINLYAAQVRRDVVRLVRPDPQFPTFENGILDQWCFITCSTGVQQVKIDGVQQVGGASSVTGFFKQKTPDGVTTMTFEPTSAAPAAGGPDYTKLVGNQPVVFLGKESSHGCSPLTMSDFYPFGCTVLQQLSKHFNSNNASPEGGLVGQTVTVTTGVNVRGGLPKPGPTGTKLGCKVQVLPQGTSVKLLSTVALKYADDTFYWGSIEGPTPVCAS